ncbi:MAG TPA: hypothetical protein DDZ42_17360 [Candidatus Rokubacteria bacterium]|nr:MAG: hypothetical protein A2050_05660 [Candidatus Rokubacteria bacterium GWA2_73_35]HBH03661.1 hypothetical protein [Candidatus Rokubacteria bacterium]
MPDDRWRQLDDDALERLLVERWLYRGVTLGVTLLAAVGVTWLGLRGVATLIDQMTVGVLVALALAAGILGFAMRQQDLRIHREIRRRRASRGREAPGA